MNFTNFLNRLRFNDSSAGRHVLRWSGTLTLDEFQRRCREHDFWYHSFYFDNGFEQRGDYDIGRNIDEYGFPGELEGKDVLDIGTGSGWFAAYFEQRGANVTTIDARGYCDFDVFGRDRNPDVATEKPQPDLVMADGKPIYYSPVSKGFWIMKDVLGLEAQYLNARVYEISPEMLGGKKFDLVFMGSLLAHLRDPIGALMAVHSVCKGQLIATVNASSRKYRGRAVMEMRPGAGDGISWFLPNRECVAEWLSAAGFSKVDVSRNVRITTDCPFVDEHGRTSAGKQTQILIHAQS